MVRLGYSARVEHASRSLPVILARFMELPRPRRLRALARLCRTALAEWQRVMTTPVDYVDSVVGMEHHLDLGLPARALAEVDDQLAGTTVDPTATLRAFMEPNSALQDDDLRLPPSAELAFYAIYNLHGLVFHASASSETVVLKQALNAAPETEPPEQTEQRLQNWWQGVQNSA